MSNDKKNLLISQTESEKMKDSPMAVDDELNNEIITQIPENTSSNSIPVDVVQNMVEYFVTTIAGCSQKIMDNNTLASDKLANMFTFVNFEGKTIELMLENKYYMDERGKKNYVQIKEAAMASTLNGIGKLSDTTNLKLYEELTSIKAANVELQEAVNKGKQREEQLQERYQDVYGKFNTLKADYNNVAVALKSYVNVTKWHENLVQEVPVIRKKNSGIIRVQTWEGAVECYIKDNPKPKVTEFDSNDFR